ncbi:MAG: Phage integrase family protein [Candidatus Bathyarchaeota archaeon BA2]|nr:MAG: Phage integrase family protein [Candidatus Bathyarchaeota archaeon BA2]
MTATKGKAGRKGHQFENDMESYRNWFTTGSLRTRYRNATKLKKYCEWIGKTPEKLLQEYTEARENVNVYNEWKRETRKRIIEFYNWLRASGYTINTARTTPLGILRFYSDNCETVRNITKEFDAVQIPQNEYVFTQDDLRKIFYYADTEGKALISVAVSLGYSAIDFLELEAQKMKELVNEARDKHLDSIMFIGKSRAKTSVQPRSFLTPEAIDSLSDYLEVLEKKCGKLPKYLWTSNAGDAHLTNQGLNKKFKAYVERANIKTYGKQVKFHLLRKFLYSRLQAKNRDIAKVITAKKVSASDLTYLPDLDKECERVFRETYKEISLNGDITGKTREKQAEVIEKLETRIKELETFNRLLQQFYTEDIVKRAHEALAQGKMTKEQFVSLLRKLQKEQA